MPRNPPRQMFTRVAASTWSHQYSAGQSGPITASGTRNVSRKWCRPENSTASRPASSAAESGTTRPRRKSSSTRRRARVSHSASSTVAVIARVTVNAANSSKCSLTCGVTRSVRSM